jgi:hypothetical protein
MFQEDFQFHPDEKILYNVRRHWIFIWLDIHLVVFYFFVLAIPVWLIQYFDWVPTLNIFGVNLYSLLDVLVYMWAIFCWLLIAEKFTDYALDFWVVTNKRVIDSELVQLFQRRLATLELRDIEDISVETTGFFSSYFSFGSLKVQTAGARNEFDMQQIANPELVQRIIFEAKLADEKEQKDIEKGEVEQIGRRVFKEESDKEEEGNFYIPHDQKMQNQSTIVEKQEKASEEFDWAHVSERQKKDIRNVEEELDEIEEKYRVNIDNALKSESDSSN